LNRVFFGIVLIAFVTAAFTGQMEAVSAAAFDSAKASVDLAIGLIGYMALFLGIMQVAQDGGLLRLLAKAIRPIMVRLFPGVPEDHPAMGAMILNISSNMLGLGNAATPFGIKAMKELNTLNDRPGVATNAMVLFLAINTSSVALLPTGVVSVRAAEGSADPWGIVAPTLVATLLSTIVGISVAVFLGRSRMFAAENEPALEGIKTAPPEDEEPASPENSDPIAPWSVPLLATLILAGVGLLVIPPVWSSFLPGDSPQALSLRAFSDSVGDWVVPVLIVSLLGFGAAKGVRVYESFVEGAKEGFEIGVKIIPFLVAILVAVGMFRASGAMDALTGTLGPLTAAIGLPGDVVPMAMVRPLSGSGAFGLMSELLHTHGPDTYTGYVASVLQGSTETTFYVLAVYFGSVGIVRVRHAVVTGHSADLAGVIAAALICKSLFGHLA